MTNSGEIHISSKNPKKLAFFYKDVLGWTMAGDSLDFDGVCFEGFNDGTTIWIWDEHKNGRKNTEAVYIMIDCPNPDTMYRDLIIKGIRIDPPKVVSWSGKGLLVVDPDGNKIMMAQS